MATLEMGKTSYELTDAEIDAVVSRVSAGNYALGRVNQVGKFVVGYIGRSDTDVAERLKDWVGKYDRFKFVYATSPQAAFEKECRDFHDFPGLDNVIHPSRPEGAHWKCPCCAVFE